MGLHAGAAYLPEIMANSCHVLMFSSDNFHSEFKFVFKTKGLNRGKGPFWHLVKSLYFFNSIFRFSYFSLASVALRLGKKNHQIEGNPALRICQKEHFV